MENNETDQIQKPAEDLPKAYDPLVREPEIAQEWENDKIYAYDASVPRKNTFVIDTPPPTVSGALHIGHVFSYVQTDIIARYQRMCGKNIFYPMGWDDNGLPTERRVQNLYGVRCDPSVPYEPGAKFEKISGKVKEYRNISRKNFLELCALQTKEDEKKYEALWRRLGISVDWTKNYNTVGEYCRRVSQRSFLDLFKKGRIYNAETPALWDTTFRTAVAQAEVEDREQKGNFHDLKFQVEGGGEFIISTTRPELLAACVAVVANPRDERYKKLFGKNAITPLFKARVPIRASKHADPEKGTGILMVCTFGDIADVEYWRKENLPLRQLIGRDGRFLNIKFGEGAFESTDCEAANAAYSKLAGLYAKKAKAVSVEMLRESGDLVGELKPTVQAVKFYEKGELPLEFVPCRQWYIKLLDNQAMLLEQGRRVKWHPEYMFKRYEQWVEGLNQDWCISRQRYFGVPLPVWYPLDAECNPDYSKPIVATPDKLPVDPQSDCPAGYSEDQRGKPNGFIGDPDVMDTWATSSLTPLISSGWGEDSDSHAKLFPADLRPQAHEIIRSWAFYTITKAWMHESNIPWYNIALSGWVVANDHSKMSKSKGGAITPENLLQKYPADALRYWSGKAKLGQDTMYDESVFKVGKRLVTKLFNASKFALLQIRGAQAPLSAADIKHALDRSWVEQLKILVSQAGENMRNFEYAAVLLAVESSFWDFCDNYLELVKGRAYEGNPEDRRSAQASLEWTLSVYLRLFAPFLPFITDETWKWHSAAKHGCDSVHKASWPSADEMKEVKAGEVSVYLTAKKILEAVRAKKAAEKRSVKWPVSGLKIEASKADIKALEASLADVLLAGCIDRKGLAIAEKDDDAEIKAEVFLAAPEEDVKQQEASSEK